MDLTQTQENGETNLTKSFLIRSCAIKLNKRTLKKSFTKEFVSIAGIVYQHWVVQSRITVSIELFIFHVIQIVCIQKSLMQRLNHKC